MSKELFYKTIAKRLIKYFRSAKPETGEKFWMRFDNQEMIDGVAKAVRSEIAQSKLSKLGMYTLSNSPDKSDVSYRTYTMDISGVEVVFAYQKEKMTTDFFATLRNDAPRRGYAIVSLAREKLDTVDTATKLLSDSGMPFNSKELKNSIEKDIDSVFTKWGEQSFLKYALKMLKEDRYSDQSALSSYETFLTIIERGKIEACDFTSLRMFPDIDFLNFNKSSVHKKRLEENSKAFEEIERAFDCGEIEGILGDTYEPTFITKLEMKKKGGGDWKAGLTYKDVKACQVKRADYELKLDDEPAEVVYLLEENSDKTESACYYSRFHDAAKKSGKRKRHLIIAVPDSARAVWISYKTNRKVKEEEFDSSKGVKLEKCQQSEVEFSILCDKDCRFDHIIIGKYVLKTAILKTDIRYFDGVKTKYEVSECPQAILVCADDGSIDFNKSAIDTKEEYIVASDTTFSCCEDQHLRLIVRDDCSVDNPLFRVNCGKCEVPFKIKRKVRKLDKIDALGIQREKFLRKESFSWVDEERLCIGTFEYEIESGELCKYLKAENELVEKGWLSAKAQNGKLTENELTLPDPLKAAYMDLLKQLREKRTNVSLAFAGSDIKDLLQEVVDAYYEVLNAYSKKDNDFDSKDAGVYDSLADVGVIYEESEPCRIWFTALHPVNIAYQLNLLELGKTGIDRDDSLAEHALARLDHPRAIPYIRYNDTYYEASDFSIMREWSFYYPIGSRKSRALGDKAALVVRERIKDFTDHFKFLFTGGSSKTLRIACCELGTCRSVFAGIIDHLLSQFYNFKIDPDAVINVHVDCYGDKKIYTDFEYLLDRKALNRYLSENSFYKNRPEEISEYECVSFIVNHLSFSLHPLEAKKEYAHLAFISDQMKSGLLDTEKPEKLDAGTMLHGAVASGSITENGSHSLSGYGSKYLYSENNFNGMLLESNVLYANAHSHGSHDRRVLTSAVGEDSMKLISSICDCSNWVVILDPKVGPLHFVKSGLLKDRPLVIHYEDKEGASGWDAITMTRKTEQYKRVVASEIGGVLGGEPDEEKVREVIDFSNAFNGTWLLKLLEQGETPRARMGMLAAARAVLHYYAREDVVWIPVSLEETLRISGSVRRPALTEINSWKNLGFKRESMTDDILLVGVTKGKSERPSVLFHPVEVKTGKCKELNRAVEQAKKTYERFMEVYWGENRRDQLTTKIARNAFMQKVLMSAEKMKACGVLPNIKWEWVTDECRTALQNEQYTMLEHDELSMPKATVCAFASEESNSTISDLEGVHILKMPELSIPNILYGNTKALDSIGRWYDPR